MSDIYCFFQFYTVRGDGQTHVVSRRSREVRTLFWVRRCKLYETATWRSLQSETCEGCYEDAEIYTIRNDHISWMLYMVQNISVSARACFSDPAWVPFIIQTSDDKVYLPNLFVKTRLVYLVKFRERFLGIQFWEQAVISLSRERKSLSERELKELIGKMRNVVFSKRGVEEYKERWDFLTIGLTREDENTWSQCIRSQSFTSVITWRLL